MSTTGNLDNDCAHSICNILLPKLQQIVFLLQCYLNLAILNSQGKCKEVQGLKQGFRVGDSKGLKKYFKGRDLRKAKNKR